MSTSLLSGTRRSSSLQDLELCGRWAWPFLISLAVPIPSPTTPRRRCAMWTSVQDCQLVRSAKRGRSCIWTHPLSSLSNHHCVSLTGLKDFILCCMRPRARDRPTLEQLLYHPWLQQACWDAENSHPPLLYSLSLFYSRGMAERQKNIQQMERTRWEKKMETMEIYFNPDHVPSLF